MKNIGKHIHHQNVIEVISVEIKRYLDENANRQVSLRSLGLHTGVCRKYIAKLMKSEVSREKLDVEKVFNILLVTSGEQYALDVLSELSPKLFSILTRGHSAMMETGYSISPDRRLDEALDTPDKFILYLLSLQGTDLKEIDRVLGERGLYALDSLIKAGLVKTEGKKVQASSGLEHISLSRDLLRNMMPHMFNFYCPENFGKEKNYIHFAYSKVGQASVKKHYELTKEYARKSIEIIRNSEDGNIPLFALALQEQFCHIVDERPSALKEDGL